MGSESQSAKREEERESESVFGLCKRLTGRKVERVSGSENVKRERVRVNV